MTYTIMWCTIFKVYKKYITNLFSKNLSNQGLPSINGNYASKRVLDFKHIEFDR